MVKETLRLYPPAWVFDRSPLRDLVVGGYTHPQGRQRAHQPVGGAPGPARSGPSRRRSGRTGSPATIAPARTAYFPFGDGPRSCVGNRFAEAEIALVLATILPRVDLSCVDPDAVRPEGDATLRPRGGLPMRVARR